MDCGMEIKVFLEGKTMIFCYQCYIYIIEDNFQKIREINLNQFVERNIFSTDMFAFMIGNDEIWVFYKEKILIFETEYFEISQM